MVQNQSYSINNGPSVDADFQDMTRPFVVNCTGYVAHVKQLRTPIRIRQDFYLRIMDTGTLLVNGNLKFSSCQFLILPPHIPFYHECLADPSTYYWIHFTGNWVEPLLQSLGIIPGCIYDLTPPVMDSVRRDFALLFQEFILKRPLFEEMTASITQGILIKLTRCFLQKDFLADASVHRSRLSASIQQMHLHFTSKLRISDLAKYDHLSVSRYREIFHLAFGTSPSEYLMNLRISHAQELLSTTNLSITEVAESCGFDDVMYFCRLFHKKVGTAPGYYRKKCVIISNDPPIS